MPRKKATATATPPADLAAVVTDRRRKRAPVEVAPAPKVNPKFEREGRLIQVQALLADGITEPEIVRWLVTEITPAMVAAAQAETPPRALVVKAWSVSDTTARDYVRTAWRGWTDEDQAEQKQQRTLDKRKFNNIYRRALASGDLTAALKAAELVARMNGSFAAYIEAPATSDMEDADAIEAIEHGALTLALGRKLGLIAPAQRALAIDVESADADDPAAPPPDPAVIDAVVNVVEPN